MSDPLAPLLTALTRETGSSSDFDLNADVGLPMGRSLRPAGVLCAIEDGPVPVERTQGPLVFDGATLLAIAAGQFDDVVPTLSECWKLNRIPFEPENQILSEFSLRSHISQVTVGG